MPTRIAITSTLAWAAMSIVFAGPASAEDVQITSEAISRVCAEIHHTPNVQAEAPTVGGTQEITLNCRLITANGPTIAQLSPSEVCQRLTGSTEWYRGDGTQVYCRARGEKASPEPRSFTITQEDIARACQRTHHNPQATAEPQKIGPYGLELNCRLVNQNGFTLARVSPEDVCFSKFGTREWIGIAGSASFLCKATPIAKTESDRFPNKGGGGAGGGGGGGGPGAFNDVPLTPEAMTRGCKAMHGESSSASATTLAQAPGYATRKDLIVNCNSGGGVISHTLPEFCPSLSGTKEWYVTDFGRGTWMPGENMAAAPRLHVCRGPGALQYPALSDINRYCIGKGHRYANFGITAQKPPACFDTPGAPINIAISDVCRDVHRAGPFERRGAVYFCLPN